MITLWGRCRNNSPHETERERAVGAHNSDTLPDKGLQQFSAHPSQCPGAQHPPGMHPTSASPLVTRGKQIVSQRVGHPTRGTQWSRQLKGKQLRSCGGEGENISGIRWKGKGASKGQSSFLLLTGKYLQSTQPFTGPLCDLRPSS